MRFLQEGAPLIVALQAPQPLSGQATAALLQELIKHFLFVRHQIPGLFTDLDEQVRNSQQVILS